MLARSAHAVTASCRALRLLRRHPPCMVSPNLHVVPCLAAPLRGTGTRHRRSARAREKTQRARRECGLGGRLLPPSHPEDNEREMHHYRASSSGRWAARGTATGMGRRGRGAAVAPRSRPSVATESKKLERPSGCGRGRREFFFVGLGQPGHTRAAHNLNY
jgi:hypothetical protein